MASSRPEQKAPKPLYLVVSTDLLTPPPSSRKVLQVPIKPQSRFDAQAHAPEGKGWVRVSGTADKANKNVFLLHYTFQWRHVDKGVIKTQVSSGFMWASLDRSKAHAREDRDLGTVPFSLSIKPELPAPTEKKSYLPDIVRKATGTEKQFFAARDEKADQPLLENLGVFRIPQLVYAGYMTPPGKPPEPLYMDFASGLLPMIRKSLVWETKLNEAEDTARVLIFDTELKSVPGLQPITVVLVDSNFKVLSWIEARDAAFFRGATLQAADKGVQVLDTGSTFQLPTGVYVTGRFIIANGTITEAAQMVEPK